MITVQHWTRLRCGHIVIRDTWSDDQSCPICKQREMRDAQDRQPWQGGEYPWRKR